jgi:lysophospholipase L1-like esterase
MLKSTSMILALLMSVAAFAADDKPVKESRWEKSIQKFEAQDKEKFPEKGGIVFVGSSSMVMWNTDKDFPEFNVINRGFGGSQTKDSVEFAHRIVIPYEPRIVALYAGDNDIAAGATVEKVIDDTKTFISIIHEALPEAKIIYVAIKPSISRFGMRKKMREINSAVVEMAKSDSLLVFADIDTPMLAENGIPRAELFVGDGLHLSREGYDLWNEVMRPLLK